MEDSDPGALNRRRSRARARPHLRDAQHALDESARLARNGDIANAERAARLAERHAKLAVQLLDLKASLMRIASARIEVERQLNESFARREAQLAAREAAQRPSLNLPPPPPGWEIRNPSTDFSAADPRMQALLTRLAKLQER